MRKSKVPAFLILSCSFAFCLLSFTLLSYAQDPKEEEGLFLAKRAFDDAFYEASLELTERFIRNYPSSPKLAEAHLLIGRCYFHQNKFLEALGKFEGLLDNPLSKDIKDTLLYWIAEVHFKGNAFVKASEYYKRLTDEFPKSAYTPSAYYSLGWCLFQEQKYSQSLEYFKAAEERFSDIAGRQDASFKIIECLYNLKDYKGLKDKARAYLKIYPKDKVKAPYLYFYIAEADYYLDNFNDAISGYAKVLDASSEERLNALSRLGMAWVYLKLKKYDDAEKIFALIKESGLDKKSRDVLLLGRAILSAEKKRFDKARDMYAELLNTSKDDTVLIQAYIGCAEAQYNMGEYKEAIDTYNEALNKINQDALNSTDILDKLHYGIAWARLKNGEFRQAIDEFQKVATQTEDKTVKVSALCQIGDTYQDSGDYDKAIQIYDSILKDYPDSLYSDYVQYQLGLALLKTYNYNGAITLFQTFKNNFPNSQLIDDAMYALGLSYLQKEDYNASHQVFAAFQEQFKSSNLRPQAMYLLGTSLYNLGRFSEAIEVFKNIIRNYNQNIDVVQKAEYEIADCFYQMGDEKEAMARFKALRSKYPDSKLTAEVMWWLGEYYYRHNDLNLARRYFSSLIKDFPQSNLVASGYYALGSTYEEEARYDEAIENFKMAMEIDSSDLAGTAAIAIADIYVKQGQMDKATWTYTQALNRHNNLAHLIYPKLGDLYSKANNYDKALEFYSKSLDVAPLRQMAQIQFKIADTLQSTGAIKDAIENYFKVTYLYSDNQDLTVKALLRIASIYENEEDFEGALNAYKKIASMDVKESKYALERIEWVKAQIK